MSLLLDALKKAEKAKEEAQRRADSDAGGAEPDQPLPADDEAPTRGTARVRTRDELPDISQSLEIATDDLSPPSAPRELTLESVEPPPAASASARARADVAPGEAAYAHAERAAARKVFEAKMREPNPRLPFFIALGVLGAVALGTLVYFWYQLRPPPSLVNANPAPTQTEQPVAIAASGPVQAAAGPAPSASDVPGLPAAPVAPPAQQPQVAASAPPAPPRAPADRPMRRAAERPAAAVARPAPPPAARVTVHKRHPSALTFKRPVPRLDPAVAAGYAAYQAGDLAAARTHYQQALRNEPASRDALLGMAALDMREQRYEAAAARYRRLLQADPRDPYALAGLLALHGERTDPLLAESRVKTLLAEDAGTDVLNFTLGNEYARQGRWAEAQQAYFKALAADPGNPDFAYNLAVSLEHIGKPKLALEQYRKALLLSEQRTASFDQAAARRRLEELSN